MLIILSPAKTFHSLAEEGLQPYKPLQFQKKTQELIEILRTYDVATLSKWMKISEELGRVNEERYRKFDTPSASGQIAMDYFNGEAYKGLEAQTISEEGRKYLSKHLVILSGLYGCIHSHEIIQPYRLEMGLKFEHPNFKSLYDYWKEELTAHVLNLLEEDTDEKVLIDLASTEYAKVLDFKKIRQYYPVVTISFKEEVSEGNYKVVGMYAKKARGRMARYMAEEQVKNVEQLKSYNIDGYSFNEDLSTISHFVFVRPLKAKKE